jgi:hypothetical protein
MANRQNPKRLVPSPPPKWATRKGVLIFAAALLLATGAVAGWWVIF